MTNTKFLWNTLSYSTFYKTIQFNINKLITYFNIKMHISYFMYFHFIRLCPDKKSIQTYLFRKNKINSIMYVLVIMNCKCILNPPFHWDILLSQWHTHANRGKTERCDSKEQAATRKKSRTSCKIQGRPRWCQIRSCVCDSLPQSWFGYIIEDEHGKKWEETAHNKSSWIVINKKLIYSYTIHIFIILYIYRKQRIKKF